MIRSLWRYRAFVLGMARREFEADDGLAQVVVDALAGAALAAGPVGGGNFPHDGIN